MADRAYDGSSRVKTQYSHRTDPPDEHERLPSHDLGPGPYGEVGVGTSVTLALGLRETVNLTVSVRMPCAHGGYDATYQAAVDFVTRKLDKRLMEYDEDRKAMQGFRS